MVLTQKQKTEVVVIVCVFMYVCVRVSVCACTLVCACLFQNHNIVQYTAQELILHNCTLAEVFSREQPAPCENTVCLIEEICISN